MSDEIQELPENHGDSREVQVDFVDTETSREVTLKLGGAKLVTEIDYEKGEDAADDLQLLFHVYSQAVAVAVESEESRG